MRLHEISIEITQQCPNNCIHCSSYSSWDATNVLPVGIIYNAIKDAVDLGVQQICISGGEPFLHENIVEIIQYVHQLGVNCVVYSSGIFFDGEKYQSIPKALLRQIKPYVTKVIINYEASNGRTYDIIMGTSCGGYRIMRQSIRSMIETGIAVETHVVPMQINVKQIFSIIKQCDRLGVTRISFLRLVNHGRVLDNQHRVCLTDAETDRLKKKLMCFTNGKSVRIRMGIPFSSCSKRINCMTGINKLNIRYDGFVYPCEAFKNDMPTGLVKSRPDNICDKSLIEIYSSSPYLKEIRELLDTYQTIHTCENCLNQYYRRELGNEC